MRWILGIHKNHTLQISEFFSFSYNTLNSFLFASRIRKSLSINRFPNPYFPFSNAQIHYFPTVYSIVSHFSFSKALSTFIFNSWVTVTISHCWAVSVIRAETTCFLFVVCLAPNTIEFRLYLWNGLKTE